MLYQIMTTKIPNSKSFTEKGYFCLWFVESILIDSFMGMSDEYARTEERLFS